MHRELLVGVAVVEDPRLTCQEVLRLGKAVIIVLNWVKRILAEYQVNSLKPSIFLAGFFIILPLSVQFYFCLLGKE